MSPTAEKRADLLLVCSTGGHLLQLVALRDAWAPFTRAWVTFDKSDARSLLRDERRHRSRTGRRIAASRISSATSSSRGASSARPGRASSSRPAPASRFRSPGSPAFAGASVVYVESLARIEGPSLTYRLIAPIASRRYVQWPELADALPGTRFAGNVFSAGA